MWIYRMHRAARAPGDFAGAMAAGGRWNPIGVPMLYAAQHLSLACIEVLVHLDKNQLPDDYVWSRAELAMAVDPLQPEGFHDIVLCQSAGRLWVENGSALAVCVASVVIPEEFNVLLNPNHSGYGGVVWSEPRPFRFDRRLFATEPAVHGLE